MTDKIKRVAERITKKEHPICVEVNHLDNCDLYLDIYEALIAERRKAYENAIEAIKAMKYDPHCAHEQYCYCSNGLISQQEAEIKIRRIMEGV